MIHRDPFFAKIRKKGIPGRTCSKLTSLDFFTKVSGFCGFLGAGRPSLRFWFAGRLGRVESPACDLDSQAGWALDAWPAGTLGREPSLRFGLAGRLGSRRLTNRDPSSIARRDLDFGAAGYRWLPAGNPWAPWLAGHSVGLWGPQIGSRSEPRKRRLFLFTNLWPQRPDQRPGVATSPVPNLQTGDVICLRETQRRPLLPTFSARCQSLVRGGSSPSRKCGEQRPGSAQLSDMPSHPTHTGHVSRRLRLLPAVVTPRNSVPVR